MTNLKDVIIGSWLDDGSGIYEVIDDYDSFHDWYLIKEVIFENESGDEYHLSDQVLKMTSNEVKRADLLNKRY